MSSTSLTLGTHLTLSDLNFDEGDRIQLFSQTSDSPRSFAPSGDAFDIAVIDSISALLSFADDPRFSLFTIDDQHIAGAFDLDNDGFFDAILSPATDAP